MPEAPAKLDGERSLVERAQAGDRRALAAILTEHGPILYRAVLLPRLGSPAAAEEALGETYAKVIERIGQFRWQGCGVYPWLRTVALRVALDQLRARRREVLFEPEDIAEELEQAERDSAAAPADVALMERRDAARARELVERALARLHVRYQTAIRRRVLEEVSREEVARELGVTVGTFDVILHRAMAALQKALAEARGAPSAR